MASSNFKFSLIQSAEFAKTAVEVFGTTDIEGLADRFDSIHSAHTKKYHAEPMFFSSPGRIEVVGNHTDHNHGQVLCAAITVDTLAAVTINTEGAVTVNSQGYAPIVLKLHSLDAVEKEKGTSRALVKGVLRYFRDHGYVIGGFDLTATSNVLKGAGVSSSASFELLIASILNEVYNDGKLSPIALAQASQYAENVYFGKPCGLMDQSAIALGGISFIDFHDTSKPQVESIPWHLGDKTRIVIIGAGGDHSDLTQDYSDIRSEMEAVAEYFGEKVLREVDEATFYAELPVLQTRVSGRAILRAIHFFNENKLVERTKEAVKNDNLPIFLSGITDSGNSSYKLLQNCYSAGDVAQRIPFALAVASRESGIQAVRVHGGGFAGTVLCFVQPEYADSFVTSMAKIFGRDSVFATSIRNKGAGRVRI